VLINRRHLGSAVGLFVLQGISIECARECCERYFFHCWKPTPQDQDISAEGIDKRRSKTVRIENENAMQLTRIKKTMAESGNAFAHLPHVMKSPSSPAFPADSTSKNKREKMNQTLTFRKMSAFF